MLTEQPDILKKEIDIFKIRTFTTDDVRICFHALKSAIFGIPIKLLLTRKLRIKSKTANKPLLFKLFPTLSPLEPIMLFLVRYNTFEVTKPYILAKYFKHLNLFTLTAICAL